MKILWTRLGPRRPDAPTLPPRSGALHGYVLVYDEALEALVYLCGSDEAGFGEAWRCEGGDWDRYQTELLPMPGEEPVGGYYDVRRRGVVLHRFAYDHELGAHRPWSALVTASGIVRLETHGDLPVSDIEPFAHPSAVAYDRKRDRGVCLTPDGLWELDTEGAWSRVADAAGALLSPWKGLAGGAWDARRERVVFWFFETSSLEHGFFGWDGERLSRIPTRGLPADELHVGMYEPSACVATHPEHGIVLVDGAEMFALAEDRWERLPDPRTPAPRLVGGRLCFDAKRRVLVLGPGHHEDDVDGRPPQQVFFELHRGRWRADGRLAEDSPIQTLFAPRRYFVMRGQSFVTRQSELETWVWRDDEWRQVVDEDEGVEAVESERLAALAASADRAVALTRKGRAFTFDGETWKESDAVPEFGERHDVALAVTAERVVAWGGQVAGRPTNHTFLCASDGAWKKVKRSSPRPADFALLREGVALETTMYWDSALERFVRLGAREVFTLEGQRWERRVPEGYETLGGRRAWEHLPAHDPLTGETLLVHLPEQRLVRFDLHACEAVGEFTLPDELADPSDPNALAWSAIREDLWFDPTTRRLHAQNVEDKWGRYTWDLSSAFEAAQSLGPRTMARDARSARAALR